MERFDDNTPIYLQIAESIREGILTCELGEEERIMSINEYATTYRINPATANKAMALLVDEGLIYKQRGIGMFVAEGARERLVTSLRATFFEDEVARLVKRAELLGISAEELATRIAERSR